MVITFFSIFFKGCSQGCGQSRFILLSLLTSKMDMAVSAGNIMRTRSVRSNLENLDGCIAALHELHRHSDLLAGFIGKAMASSRRIHAQRLSRDPAFFTVHGCWADDLYINNGDDPITLLELVAIDNQYLWPGNARFLFRYVSQLYSSTICSPRSIFNILLQGF